MRFSALVALLLMAMAAGAARADDTAKPASKHHYLVSMTHTAEDCARMLDAWTTKEHKQLLSRTEWGCSAGDHTGWVVVEASSEQAAIALLPQASRASSKAVMVEVMSKPEHFKMVHQQLQQANALQKGE